MADAQLTDLERMLLKLLLRIRILLHECSPDVGMGPSNAAVLDEVCEMAGVRLSNADYGDILASLRKRDSL